MHPLAPINLHNKCVQASFSSICVCYLVRCLIVAHLSSIRAGSTRRSLNVQRDISALQSPAGAERCGFNMLIGKLSGDDALPA